LYVKNKPIQPPAPPASGRGAPPVVRESVESIELSLLLDAINRLYGYDFRDYNQLSLLRRIEEWVGELQLPSMLALLDRMVHDESLLDKLLIKLTVNVTSFFRNPEFFAIFRTHVLPELAKHEFIRIWHAGCATGQEVYSAAILLDECGLLERTRIYATDLNRDVLLLAQSGIFTRAEIEAAEQDYRTAGGTQSLMSYATPVNDTVVFDRRLRERIVFAQHDLVKDGRFNDFDVIFSRNVLVHFNARLQERALALYTQSMRAGGYLGLGERETVMNSPFGQAYEPLAGEDIRLYRYTRSTVANS
jgi:chemotaxis protein methyltransferase CheR